MDTHEAFYGALERLAAQMNEPEVKKQLEIRKEAGRNLDPETADVIRMTVETLDPYGLCPQFQELSGLGKELFARAKGGDIWVSFKDLPGVTVDRLWERMASGDLGEPARELHKHLELLATREVLEMIQRALSLDFGGTDFRIDDCTRLADGRFQVVVRADRFARMGSSA